MEDILAKLASGMGEAWPLALLLLYYLRRMESRFDGMAAELKAIREAVGGKAPAPSPEPEPPARLPDPEEKNVRAIMEIRALASERYGPGFLPAAEVTAANIGIPLDDLLAVIAAETNYFSANGGRVDQGGTGQPWPVNGGKDPYKGDGGGGLIGWTKPAKKGQPKNNFNTAFPTIAAKGPGGQLDDVQDYYERWFNNLGIDGVGNLLDAYLIVRGPGAITNPAKYAALRSTAEAYINTIAEGRGKGGPFAGQGAAAPAAAPGGGAAGGAIVALAIALMTGVGLYLGRKG